MMDSNNNNNNKEISKLQLHSITTKNNNNDESSNEKCTSSLIDNYEEEEEEEQQKKVDETKKLNEYNNNNLKHSNLKKSNKRKKKSKNNFIRRLLSCGGSCTGERNSTNSLTVINSSTSAAQIALNKISNLVVITSPPAETTNKQQKERKTSDDSKIQLESNEKINNDSKKFQSQNCLLNNNNLDKIENSYESYESIIDTFVNSNLYNNTQEKYLTNNDNNNNNNNVTPNITASTIIANNDSTKIDENEIFEEKILNDVKIINSKQLILPILKINDDFIIKSSNIAKKKEIHISNTSESLSVEEEYDEDEEIIDIDEDEEDDEEEDDENDDEEYEDECENLKLLILNETEEFDEFDVDNNNYYNDDNGKIIKNSNKNALKSNNKQLNKTNENKKLNQTTDTTATTTTTTKELADDKLLVKQIEILGCHTSLSYESSTTPSRKSNDLNDSSTEYFFQNACIRSSLSNFSIKNNFENETNEGALNSADNGANLFVPLLNRKSKSNSKLIENELSILSSSIFSSTDPMSKSPSPLLDIKNDVVKKQITNRNNATQNTTNQTKHNEPLDSQEKSEESDVLNEISKVKNWLTDSNNIHRISSTNLDQSKPIEKTDSAIDMRSNYSVSNVSKRSNDKTIRIRWESFKRYYQTNYSNSENTQNYQISAMSLDQLMSLRKIALLQFSKLLERQHSTMIRTLRLFSKNKDIAEFQRVYDSIDSLAKAESSKSGKSTISNDESINSSNENYENLIIENKKIQNQLGAPKSKKNKNNLLKSNTSEKMKGEKSSIIDSGPNRPIEKVILINTKGFASTPATVFGTSLNAIMQHTGQPLPNRILEALRIIRKKATNEVGIFRKNGVKTRINKLKESINRNESIDYQSSDYSVFDIADMIKLYFRELPECLITNKLSDILLSNYDRIQPEERKMLLQQVMLLIPDENRLVLQTLLLFLNEIARNYKTNQMTRSNLAVCFSPVIFHFNLEKKSKLKQNMPIALPTNMTNTINNNNPSEISSKTNSKENIDDGSNNNYNNNQALNTQVIIQKSTSTSQTETNETKLTIKQDDNLKNKKLTTNKQIPLVSINEFTQLNSTTSEFTTTSHAQSSSSSSSTSKQNYKRKYSEKINKAASSIVNFGAELNKSNKILSSSFESMSKIIQLCVSDMIKYSLDLFNVPSENFEKIKLTISNSDPYSLDYYYDTNTKSLKKPEFFITNIKLEKSFWHYMDKFEDVTVYFSKNENSNELKHQQEELIALPELSINENSSATIVPTMNETPNSPTMLSTNIPNSISNSIVTSTNFLTLMPQKFETFNDKLKLWKCCTLIKHQNLTLEKILNRIKNERHLWDDDFIDGRIVEVLDENTELYDFSISFMAPHPQRNIHEIRHTSKQESARNETIILTSVSVKETEKDTLSHEITSNLAVSKYVIEKLIATDTTTTFKITHYIKLDYKGFTLEFYNKTFGYVMARQLYNLKMSFNLNNK